MVIPKLDSESSFELESFELNDANTSIDCCGRFRDQSDIEKRVNICMPLCCILTIIWIFGLVIFAALTQYSYYNTSGNNFIIFGLVFMVFLAPPVFCLGYYVGALCISIALGLYDQCCWF